MNKDTIAAVSTALSDSGIGIIRVSGKEAISIVDKLYVDNKGEHKLASFPSHTIHYGFIVFEGHELDEVMVSIMKAPSSFTKEDVVEINCHGGVFVIKTVLDAVLRSGARLAEPGEFTKRAFLNGRIDLSKAEAVMDVISSESKAGLDNSLKHLNGNLYNKIRKIREDILYETAFIESALDDPEHFSLDDYPEKLLKKILKLKEETDKLYMSFKAGRILKEGIKTVILGKPNVGKSSLLNVLTGEERAIVTMIPGTTRDTIEEKVRIGDVYLNLFDTAGIRETEDFVENIGVKRAREAAQSADLILFLIDSSLSIEKEDIEIYEYVKNKNIIVLLNKTDVDGVVSKDDIISSFGECDVIEISCATGAGIDILTKTINEKFYLGNLKADNELVITNLRQAEELRSTSSSFENVINSINNGLPEDFYSIDLMNAYSSLGKIIGEDVDEDLVNEIFMKFCMGK